MTERIWFCKVGGEADFFQNGADGPMQRAVAKAFREITGRDPQFTFSGWGGELTEGERAVVENREPRLCEIDQPHQYECKRCGIGPPTTAQETFSEPVPGVVPGSELERQIQQARRAIAGWPDDVKRAMNIQSEPEP